MHALLAYFLEDDPHRILIPRGRLLLFFLLLFLFEAAVCLTFYQILTILSLFLMIPTVYLGWFGLKLWRRYYAVAWYPVCLCLLSAAAYGVRVGVYHIL